MEIYHLGWNVETIGLAGTIIFTILQMVAYGQQGVVVWRQRSVEGISIYWFLFSHFTLWGGFVYGVWGRKLGIGFNGAGIALATLPIVIGIVVFHGLTKIQKLFVGALVVALVAMICSSQKEIIFFGLSLGNVAFLGLQPAKMWWHGKNGVVKIGILLVSFTSTVFWDIYSFAVGDIVLRVVCPIYSVVILMAIILWFKNRKAQAATA